MIIKEQVVSTGQLILDHCNFTNFKDNVAISVNGFDKADGVINIDVCNFVNCKKGAIDLNVVESGELRISYCYFISCSDKSDVIKLTSKGGTIQYCKFLNNKITEAKLDSDTQYGVIRYENSSPESNDILAIRQCFFEHNNPYDQSIFLTFKSNSKFELTYNVFKIYYYNEYDKPSDTRILRCSDGHADIRKYTIKGNTLYPFESYFIGNDIDYPPRGFTKPLDSECPGLPEGVENTGKNELCSNIGEATEDPLIQSHTIVSIYYSSFSVNGNQESLGGAVYVYISQDLAVDPKTPIEIYYSAFIGCIAKYGCGIYLESTQESRLFDIHRCSFISNTDSYDSPQCQGAGIYIKSSLSTFKISRCFFNDNRALEGGGIYFTNDVSTASKSLLDAYEDDVKFALNVKECVFISNSVNDNGGAVCIKITDAESLKPIDINSCIFLGNMNVESTDDGKDELGGAIYYSFNSDKTGSASCTFRVYNSVFEDNEVNNLGGSIYVTLSSSEQANSIEIDNCSFNANKAQNGGSIYMVANNGKQIEISHCLFEKSESTGSDSIYIKSESTTATFNVIDCDFVSNSIFFEALSGSIDNCRFSEYGEGNYAVKYLSKSTVSETKPTLSISKCDFNQAAENVAVSLVYFEEVLKSIFSFTDNIINFKDKNSHVLDCKSGMNIPGINNDYWYFNNNTIDPPIYEIIKTEAAEQIPAKCGTQFSCPVETPTETPIETPVETPTEELPKEESQSKEPPSEEPTAEQSSSQSEEPTAEQSSPVEQPPEESSSEEFSSESESPSQELPTDGNCIDNNPCNLTGTDGNDHIDITDRNYTELRDRITGAAIRLLNYSLTCLKTNFTSCEVSHGGGGIFIVLQKALSMHILLENLTFKYCKAVYGGAVYIYSDQSENLIKIISCVFEENTANRKQEQGFESHLYGGAACYLQTTNSNITECLFYRNHGSGLKVYNDFDAPPKEMARILENDQQVSLSIKDCIFEAEKDSSSSSLFFVRGPNYEVPIEVKDCTFKGELKTGTYHIDGDSLSMNKKEKSKLRIMSCKFSSDEEKALSKKPMLFESLDKNSQLFNYKEVEDVNVVHYNDKKVSKKSNNNNGLSVMVAASTVFAVIAVIAAMAIIIKKLKSQTSKDENIDSDNVIELNTAEL